MASDSAGVFSNDAISPDNLPSALVRPDLRSRNDTLKLVYQAQLLNFAFDEIEQFWRPFLLVPGGDQFANVQSLLKHIWIEKKHLPFEFMLAVLNQVEIFLDSRGVDPARFIATQACPINGGTLLCSRRMLEFIVPRMATFFRVKNVYGYLMKLMEPVNAFMNPGTIQRLVAEESNGEERTAVLCLVHDDRYSPDFPTFNPHAWLIPVHESMPAAMGLPPFEEVSMLGDRRPAASLLSSAGVEPRVDNEKLVVADEVVGRAISFRSLLEELAIDHDCLPKFPDCKVMRMDRDVAAAEGNGIVLHGGTAYGCPFYLSSIRYKPAAGNTSNPLKNQLDDALEGPGERAKNAQRLHGQFCDYLTRNHRPLEIVFAEEHDRLLCNERILARSAPARLMACMIEDYAAKGKKEFHYWELQDYPHALPSRTSHHLSRRIERLIKALPAKSRGAVRLRKSARGRVELSIAAPFRFTRR